jgi:hypothetical protein
MEITVEMEMKALRWLEAGDELYRIADDGKRGTYLYTLAYDNYLEEERKLKNILNNNTELLGRVIRSVQKIHAEKCPRIHPVYLTIQGISA